MRPNQKNTTYLTEQSLVELEFLIIWSPNINLHQGAEIWLSSLEPVFFLLNYLLKQNISATTMQLEGDFIAASEFQKRWFVLQIPLYYCPLAGIFNILGSRVIEKLSVWSSSLITQLSKTLCLLIRLGGKA